MKKYLLGALVAIAVSGCATNAHFSDEQVFYTAPPNVVYVAPYYPAPSIHWHWAYSYRHGWGWHHRHHGFHRYHGRRH